MTDSLSDTAKLLLLTSLLVKDNIISENGRCFLKELMLRKDPRVATLLSHFENRDSQDASFLEYLHALIEDEARQTYNELYRECSLEHGKMLSKEERDSMSLESKSLIYGEVEFDAFTRILRKLGLPPGLKFVDLGSGTGRAVFVARLTQDFEECLGIELLRGLASSSVDVLERFERNGYRDLLSASQSQNVRFLQGSITEVDEWVDADVVFANSTCFDESLIRELARMGERMKPGAFFITFTKGLDSEHFEVLERKRYGMSWGPATVYVQRRLQPDGSSVDDNFRFNAIPSDALSYQSDDDYNAYDFANYNYVDDDDDDDYEDEDEDDEEEEDDEYGTGFGPSGQSAPYGFDEQGFHQGLTSPQDTMLMNRKMKAQRNQYGF